MDYNRPIGIPSPIITITVWSMAMMPSPPSHERRRIIRALALASLAAALLVHVNRAAAQQPPRADLVRPPWTTSRVIGSPDPPPPFKVVRAFPNLKFEKPLLLARCPGSDRLFVGEQAGVLYSFVNQSDAKAELFCDLRKELTTVKLLPDAQGVESVYGLAFHPDFQTNRQCFVCYTLRGNKR